jgi:SAM-dependent methyltransferase
MTSPDRCLVYESGPVRDATGDTIRPGGFYLTRLALDRCGFKPGAKVLDVGCGTGATVEYLIQCGIDAVGIDPSEALLEAGRRRNPGLPLMHGSGESIPFAGCAMDGVFAECSLSLISDTERAIFEMHRVLKSGGWLVLTDVYVRNAAFINELRLLPLGCCVTGALPGEEFARKLVLQGFDVILWEDHTKLLKELTARLIWSHGSMDSFWRKMLYSGGIPPEEVCSLTYVGDIPPEGVCPLTANGCDPGVVKDIIAGSKPGYFLLLAQKVTDC